MLIFCAGIETGLYRDTGSLDRLLEQIADGDKHALADLYEAVRVPVYSYALSILKHAPDAEDVLHDCFLSIHTSAAGYRSVGKPMAWILTITRNLCLMKLREKNRDRNSRTDIPDEDWDTHLGLSDETDICDRLILEECMGQLSDMERQIVVLHVVSGLKHREIAGMLSIPLATVLSRYSRAVKKLKVILEREG